MSDLTVKQAAAELQQSPALIYRLLQTKRLRGYKIGLEGTTSPWRVPMTAIEEYRNIRR